MKDIIDAAADTAKRTGATVVVIGAPNGNGTSGAPGDIQVKHLQETVTGLQNERAHLTNQNNQLLRERDEARVAFEQARAKVVELQQAAVNGNGPGAAAALQQAINERDTLKAKVDELQGLISQLRAGSATTAPMNGTIAPVAVTDPGKPEPRFADYGIEILGLSEDAAKKVAKIEPAPKTIGELCSALEAGRIKGGKEAKPQFTKDECIEIASKVALGRVPTGSRPAAPSVSPGAASDIPAGHKDRGWMERLESMRKKEAAADKARTDLARMIEEQKRLETGEKNPDTMEALKKLQVNIVATDKNLGLFEGQVLAFLWAMNLPVKDKDGRHHRVDGALAQAGLVHLVQAAPAGAGV